MLVIQAVLPRITKSEAAKLLGLKSFDTALPQDWLDSFVEGIASKLKLDRPAKIKLYDKSLSSLVWAYDGNPFGGPYPLTPDAVKLLELHDDSYASKDFNVISIAA